MPVKVVDASAIAALVFGEPEAADVAARLHTAKLVAPGLLPFEIASVCLKKLQRHHDQRESLLTAHRLFERLDITQTKVELPEVVKLAEQAGLTAYDASYLWLARRLQAELVTLDGQLARAAVKL
jgi:Predicted nucleic acid-binding protein, contains PIN domain